MSLSLTYHNKEFGIVCTDGRVSMEFPDGRLAAVLEQTARKFIVLRTDPGLVLAGTSSFGMWHDFSVCDAMRRYVEDFPEASFDDVSRLIGPTVYEARAAFRVGAPFRKPKSLLGGDGNFLNLLGYDRERRCVRNRVFSCTDRCEESEQELGVTISGFLDPDQAWDFAGDFLELIGRERTPAKIVEALLSVAEKISAFCPERIGPPYFFQLVTKGASLGGGIIEEQFRRALAVSENRAVQRGLNVGREIQQRTQGIAQPHV